MDSRGNTLPAMSIPAQLTTTLSGDFDAIAIAE
jgi:hypothetical protein